MSENLTAIEHNQRRMRREVLIRRVLYTLEDTIRLRGMTPDTPVDEVRIEFTDASARVIATLAEAVEILEAIIWASDGCMGHRQCVHSMEPWQRARALLSGKWEAETGERKTWPSPDIDEAIAKAGE